MNIGLSSLCQFFNQLTSHGEYSQLTYAESACDNYFLITLVLTQKELAKKRIQHLSPSFTETRTSYLHDRCPEIMPSEHTAILTANKHWFICTEQTASNGLEFEASFPTIRTFSHQSLKAGGKKMFKDISGPHTYSFL